MTKLLEADIQNGKFIDKAKPFGGSNLRVLDNTVNPAGNICRRHVRFLWTQVPVIIP